METIPHRVLRQAATQPSTIAYQVKSSGRWQPTTWRTYGEQIRTAGRALIALGVAAGGRVAILGFNRPEWVILDHATMMVGGAPAGIYTTSSPDEVAYIIQHSEASVVLVESAAQLAKVQAQRANLPRLAWIVMMNDPETGVASGGDVLTWGDFLAKAAQVPDATLDQRLAALDPHALATLIYTSGTTGPPKAVMLSHNNLAWTADLLCDLAGWPSGGVSLSYLPLSHIAEQMATVHLPATAGSTVYFAESLEKLAANLVEARPTVFFGVPRIWEKLHAGLEAKLGEATGVKRQLADWARGVCSRVNAHRDRGEPLPTRLELQYRLAVKLVISKVKVALGLDRATQLYSGAAPIAPAVLEFLASLDLQIMEIYGQSEDCGPTSCNLPGKTRIGTVGPALPGIEVSLASDGEILVRGPNVFLGYLKEPAATAETLIDGRLATGDLGSFDKDGFLSITGRKKELIITAGGKNIAPKNIEALIKGSPLVSEAVVIGDRRKYLTALVTLDAAATQALSPEDVRAQIQRTIDQANETLARVEQVKRFAVLTNQFGIETGELTPTLKIKRQVVAQKFAHEIDQMYVEE